MAGSGNYMNTFIANLLSDFFATFSLKAKPKLNFSQLNQNTAAKVTGHQGVMMRLAKDPLQNTHSSNPHTNSLQALVINFNTGR